MRRPNVVVAVIVFCLSCSVLAYSDSISTFQTGLAFFQVTSASGTFGFGATLRFGAGGISVQGMTAACGLCVSGVDAGTVVPLTLTIESGTGSATIDGVQYNSLFFHGFLELATTPSKLTLPSGSGDFSRFVLFGFGGQLNACPSSPSGLGCSSADIATFMIGAGGPDGFVSFRNEGGRYTLNSATFDNCCAAPVPEPQSFILLSTGALAVAGRLIRTRRRQW